MSNDFDTSANIHIYKPSRRTLALNIFLFLSMGIVMGIPFLIFVLMVQSIIRTQPEFFSLAMAFGCLLTPLIILLGLNIILMTTNTILSFFSYIKISPDDIEQKYAISKHIRSNWSDVDKLEKYFLFSDAIYLNSYEVVGTSLSLKSPFRFLRPKQSFISLTGYEGWPEGGLANDLKQYAPQLFEAQSVLQESRTKNMEPQKEEIQVTNTSQENRLLAALSHASVLFSVSGIIVPIVIYATQKKKSSYIAF